MLPVPTLSVHIDARGNVTIAGWSPPQRPRAEGFRKPRKAGFCGRCGKRGHIASNRRCPARER